MAANLLYGRPGSLKNSDAYGWASPGYFFIVKTVTRFEQMGTGELYIAPF
jgi:hypothetical protein